MIDLGDQPVDTMLRIPFSTFDSNGGSVTMTAFTTADIEIYKDGSVTERTGVSGLVATTDFDGKTGLHLCIIDLSDDDDAGFFAAGSEYLVHVGDVTVDGQTVRFFIARFTIEVANGALARIKLALPAVAANGVGGLPTAPAAGLFTGMSRLPDWLGAMAGKQVADSTAITEIKATGAGSGGFDEAADSLEAVKESIGKIASTGAALTAAAESVTLTTGTESSGTFADTESHNGVSHEHTDAGGQIELYYEFDVGSTGIAVEVEFTALINGSNDDIDVYVWDWIGSDWELFGSISGTNSQTFTTEIDPLFGKHTGTSGDVGKVRIRFFKASGLTSATLKVDQVFIAFATAMRGTDNVVLLGPTKAEMDTAHGNLSTPAQVKTQVEDTLKDHGLVLHRAAIETVTDQTHYIIPATDDAVDNDAYNGGLAVIIDQSDANQVSIRAVVDYVASTRSVEIASAADFTVVAGDILSILPLGAEQIADFVADEPYTGATHNVSQSLAKRIRELQENAGYENGAVWLDTNNGTSGLTEDFVNGTVNNPVDDIDDARTIADSVGLKIIHVLPGSAVTLTQSFANFELIGFDWTLAFSSQSVDNCLIIGSSVSGTFVGMPRLERCSIGNITGASVDAHICGLAGTITVNGAGDWFIHHSFSKIAGTSTPVFDFGASAGTTNLNMRDYSGGIDLRNHGQTITDNSSIEGRGQVTINVNCTGGTIVIRGNFKLTNNGSSTVDDEGNMNATIVGDAVLDEALSGHTTAGSLGKAVADIETDATAILEDTGTTIPALIGTPAADLAADIAAVKVDTAAILIDTAVLGAAMPDSIPADGTIPSPIEALYMLVQFLFEGNTSGTTYTVKKVDGSTTLFTLTMNDASTPTSLSRTT